MSEAWEFGERVFKAARAVPELPHAAMLVAERPEPAVVAPMACGVYEIGHEYDLLGPHRARPVERGRGERRRRMAAPLRY